jgi:hypothetical protein
MSRAITDECKLDCYPWTRLNANGFVIGTVRPTARAVFSWNFYPFVPSTSYLWWFMKAIWPYGGRGQKSCNCQGSMPHSLKWQGRCTATRGRYNYRVLRACHVLIIVLKPCKHN